MKQKYDLIVIGFGKAGKTLAAKLSKMGKSVALIEKDKKTCNRFYEYTKR